MSGCRILCLNLGKRKAASLQLCQTMLEDEVDFALIQEPLLRIIGDKSNHMGIAGGFISCFVPSPKCRAIILHKPSLPVVFLEHLSTPDCSVVRVDFKDYPFLLVSAYFDGERQVSEDLTVLNRVIAAAPFGRVLIHTDSNSRSSLWLDSKTNCRGIALADWLGESGLSVLNNSSVPTFVRPDGAGTSNIDVSFTDQETRKLVESWRLCDEFDSLSDHNLIEIRLNIARHESNNFSTRKYFFRQSDLPLLTREIAHSVAVNWDDSNCSPETLVSEFNNRMLAACDKTLSSCMPLKPKRSILWWDREVRAARSLKNRAVKNFQKAKNGLSEFARLQAKNLMLEARENYRKLIVKKGPIYWKSFTASLAGRDVYQVLKRLDKSHAPVKPMLSPNGELVESECEAVELIATHFFGCLSSPPPSLTFDKATEPFPACELTALKDELREIVYRFGKNKAPGPDGITADILRAMFEANSDGFTRCFSLCLLSHHFPDPWKQGTVVMIPKNKPGSLTPSSFRPITLLPLFGKVLERLMARRLLAFIESSGGLHDAQFGFRSGRSTTDALMRLNKVVRDAHSSGRMVLIISLDISAAFDSVKWVDIINSLKKFNIPNYLINLCSSFFSNRSVTIRYGKSSAHRWLYKGCPQGSITGPLFWNVVFDDLLRRVDEHGRIIPIAYADDLLLLIRAGTSERLELEANSVLEDICEWGRERGLVFNASKTQCLLRRCRGTQSQPSPNIVMQGEQLVMSDELLYLGVRLHSSGSWLPHLKAVRAKVVRRLSTCGRIAGRTWGLGKSIRERLYQTIAIPILLYAAPAWAPKFLASGSGRRALLSAQRPSLIWCTGAFSTASTQALCLLSDKLPLNLEAKYRVACHKRRRSPTSQPKSELLRSALSEWRTGVESSSLNPVMKSIIVNGRIPNSVRLSLGYWATQIVTNHGHFNNYVAKMRSDVQPSCYFCHACKQDNTHVLLSCPFFSDLRQLYGVQSLSLNSVGTSQWQACFGGVNLECYAKHAIRRCILSRRRVSSSSS